jgi:hypothetical protein
MHQAIIAIAFCDGLISYANISPGPFRQFAQLLVMILFINKATSGKVFYPYFWYVASFTAVAALSALVINDVSHWALFTFLRQVLLVSYTYFLVIYNERSSTVIGAVHNTLKFFILAQIPAFLIKLLVVGLSEDNIGTLSRFQGSITTVAAMLASAYCFGKYLSYRRNVDLAWCFVPLVLSQINEKRGVILYIPVLFIIMTMIYFARAGRITFRQYVSAGSAVILIGLVALYAVARLNVTLNPEGKVGGSFSPSFLVEYIAEYNLREGDMFDLSNTSRLQALILAVNYTAGNSKLKLLFGEGAGHLTYANSDVSVDKDPVDAVYGIGYGGRVGLVWLILQVGVLGVAIYLAGVVRLIRDVYAKMNRDHHRLAALGCIVALVLDVGTYSSTPFQYFSILGTVAVYCAMVLKNRTPDDLKEYLRRKTFVTVPAI